LAPISVILNDLEWRNSLILHYFTEFDGLAADYVTVVVDRLIRSDAEYTLSVIFLPKLTHTAVARCFCDS